MTTNGTKPISSIVAIEAADVRGDLDAWDSEITRLDRAMREAAACRRDIEEQSATWSASKRARCWRSAVPTKQHVAPG